MADKNKIVDKKQPPMLFMAAIKEGWNGRLFKPGYIILTHRDHPARVVELASIREGDELPRDTDEALAFPPAVGGS